MKEAAIWTLGQSLTVIIKEREMKKKNIDEKETFREKNSSKFIYVMAAFISSVWNRLNEPTEVL